MAFDIPDLAQASFPGQARLYSSDLAILGATASISGVKSGCAVTAQASPNMTLAVASGIIYWLGAEVTVTAGNVTITAAHATNPRIDLVVASSTGVKSVIAGTAAAIPTQPALGATSVALAQVYVPAADTAIGSTQVRDRRVVITVPVAVGAPTIVRKTADESVTSSVTLQDDNHLFFSVLANTIYAVKFVLEAISTGNQIGRYAFTAPTSTVYRFTGGSGVTIGSDSLTQQTFGQPSTGLSVVTLLEGTVATAGTAGTFRLQWAQNSSDAVPLRMLTNSYAEYRVVP